MENFHQVINRENTRSVKWDLREKLFKSKDVLPMWVADMDFATCKAVEEAIHARAQHNLYGYNIIDEPLLDAIKYWVEKRHQWTIEKNWLTFSPGVVTSLHMIVQALTTDTDAILIQTPVYPPFYGVIEKHGRKIVTNPLILRNNKYEIDFDDFERKIKNEKVAMFILCNPHNPVGRVWTKEELSKMLTICRKYDCIIVSDEIHSDLIYKNHKHIPIASMEEDMREKVITCMAPSKTFNLAGLQASYIICPNTAFKNKINEQFINQGIHGLNTFGLVAMEAVYLHGEQWLEELLAVLEDNINYAIKTIHEHTNLIQVVKPEGTYLLWLDCRKMGLNNKQLKEFFQEKAKVGLNDGASFGNEGEGFMRLNIASPKVMVEEGINRILKAVSQL
jgi:cysteine-S-conjugate beta-lyase